MKNTDFISAGASQSNDSIITMFQVRHKITENKDDNLSTGNGDGKHLIESPSLINLVKLAGKRTDQGTEYILIPVTSWGKNCLLAGNMNLTDGSVDTSLEYSECNSDSEHEDRTQNDLNKPNNIFLPNDNSNHTNPFKLCFPFIFRKKEHTKK